MATIAQLVGGKVDVGINVNFFPTPTDPATLAAAVLDGVPRFDEKGRFVEYDPPSARLSAWQSSRSALHGYDIRARGQYQASIATRGGGWEILNPDLPGGTWATPRGAALAALAAKIDRLNAAKAVEALTDAGLDPQVV